MLSTDFRFCLVVLGSFGSIIDNLRTNACSNRNLPKLNLETSGVRLLVLRVMEESFL
jgi:hypothetical protein